MTNRSCLDCHRIIPGNRSRCPACQLRTNRQRAAARDPNANAVYRSRQWRTLATEVVAAAWRCHWCHRVGVRLSADHVIPIVERPDLAMDPGNLVAACYSCQNLRRSPANR